MRRILTGPPPRTAMPPGATDSHIHVYLPGFPAAEGFVPLPPAAPGIGEYEQVMDRLGIERVVVVQGNAHGFSNDNVVAALAALGDRARGVGVVTAGTTDAEMERLHAAGMRGARIMNIAGATGMDRLEEVNARTHAFGWSLIVQFDGAEILDRMPQLEAIRGDWVLDHHGKFLSHMPAPDAPEVDAILRLIDRGNCHFKLAGGYESSRTGGPDFEDVAAISRRILAHASERAVWGSNWPHNGVTREEDYPDDAALLDTVLGWAPDDRARQQILVETPARLYGFGA